MMPDEEGFFYPVIDEKTCIHCDQCRKVCPALKKESVMQAVYEQKAYAGSCMEKNRLLRSSSGGAAYALAKCFLQQSGTVFGVRYNEDYRGARFTQVNDLEELDWLSGSKYVESDRQELFRGIKPLLASGRRVLVIGLPCDIAAVRSLMGWDPNLYTCKLICRSNTSNKVLRDFLDARESEQGSKLTRLSLRYKIDGEPQLPTRVRVDFEDGNYYLEDFVTTDFGIAFQILTRPSCSCCHYKSSQYLSDVTVGDFQGISRDAEYFNINGVSLIFQHTPKGKELLQDLDAFYLNEVPFDSTAKYNWMTTTAIPESPFRKNFSDEFKCFGLVRACRKLRESQNAAIDRIANSIVSSGARVAVWGIGDTTERLYDRFDMASWNIVGVFDSSPLKIGRQFRQWQVQNILDIKGQENGIDLLVVMIPSENEKKLNLFLEKIGWKKAFVHAGKYKYYRG